MEPRLKTAIWVDAFLRQAAVSGFYGTVLTKGHEDAGQVFVLFNRPDRQIDVLVPPPGPAFDAVGMRRFEKALAAPRDWPSLKAWLDRKRSFDPDLWIVEIDAREGFAGLQPEKD